MFNCVTANNHILEKEADAEEETLEVLNKIYLNQKFCSTVQNGIFANADDGV